MTHFGILSPAGAGHLNPMTTLGRHLSRRGHRVTVIGIPDAEATTRQAGLEFRPIGRREFPPGALSQAHAVLGALHGSAAARYTVALLRRGAGALLREGPDAVRDEGIDALLVDQVSFAGGTVAEQAGIPFVSVCCALMMNREPDVPPVGAARAYRPTRWGRILNQFSFRFQDLLGRPVASLVNGYRRRWRLPPLRRIEDTFSSLAQISQQPAAFEFPRRRLPACFHFTGPFHDRASRKEIDFPFDQLTGRPLIYVSLGTIQNRLLHVFERVAHACQGLDAQVVLSLGGGCERRAVPSLPGSPLIVEYAPQLDLLRRARLTITHAGMNTTLESLSEGTPLVALPITNDQPGVAARIRWTGVGDFVPLKRLQTHALREVVHRVWSDDAFRAKAQAFQADIHRADGLTRAATIIESAMASERLSS